MRGTVKGFSGLLSMLIEYFKRGIIQLSSRSLLISIAATLDLKYGSDCTSRGTQGLLSLGLFAALASWFAFAFLSRGMCFNLKSKKTSMSFFAFATDRAIVLSFT